MNALLRDCPAPEPEQIVPVALPGSPGFGLLQPAAGTTGVLILVGGPQYRVGSHRHFVQLARALGAAGLPSLRFDQRGVGDALGPLPDFQALDADLRAGLDALLAAQPQIRRVVLWGLCDAASAALLYVARQSDPRVAGLALLNPWVRSPQGEARARVQHYYWERLRSPEFWRKLLGGGVGLAALRGWWQAKRAAAGPVAVDTRSYQEQMAAGWRGFAGPILLQLSGRDHTAREFEAAGELFPGWQGWAARPALDCRHYPSADHTFSGRAQMQQSFADLVDWLNRNFA